MLSQSEPEKAIGESLKKALRAVFDRSLRLEFQGAKVVRHARYVTFQMAAVAVSRNLFRAILERIHRLGSPPLWMPG